MLAPSRQNYQLLETIAITNQTADTTAVTKGVHVPPWANHATFVIELTMTGTTPTFDFVLQGVNVAVAQPPDDSDVYNLGGWDGITQKTAATAQFVSIDVGPSIDTDDTGSATASDRYGVAAFLPPVIAYKYTTTGADDDEDYAATISVYWGK